MTCEDVVPLSAVATICDGQFENTGAETSVKEKNIYLKKHTHNKKTKIYIYTHKSLLILNCFSQSAS